MLHNTNKHTGTGTTATGRLPPWNDLNLPHTTSFDFDIEYSPLCANGNAACILQQLFTLFLFGLGYIRSDLLLHGFGEWTMASQLGITVLLLPYSYSLMIMSI